MIREVMKYLDASFCAETALALFLIVFTAITIRTILMKKAVIAQQAGIPLSDGAEVSQV